MDASNVWLKRRILAYAHQGGSLEEPSSTLHAIQRAIENGADAIELDVHGTKDGHIVVCHDPTIDRTTDGRGQIADFTLEELKQFDNAYWFSPFKSESRDLTDDEYIYRGLAKSDNSFRIATIEEILSEFKDMIFNFDIKRTSPDVKPYEEILAEKLRKFKCSNRVIVASFLDGATRKFKELAPEFYISAGTSATSEFFFAEASDPLLSELDYVALQVPYYFNETQLVTESFIQKAHSCNVAVHVWTINEEAQMQELIDLGVDGIITDRPTLLSSVLKGNKTDKI
jgi:glycerophosphoryl diester phosphodiesterase